nr:transposase [Vibrio pelagius]
MLKIIFYAYSLGMLSSRRIERACINNITFMCLSGDVRPHFTTIAAFIAKMKDTIKPHLTHCSIMTKFEVEAKMSSVVNPS